MQSTFVIKNPLTGNIVSIHNHSNLIIPQINSTVQIRSSNTETIKRCKVEDVTYGYYETPFGTCIDTVTVHLNLCETIVINNDDTKEYSHE